MTRRGLTITVRFPAGFLRELFTDGLSGHAVAVLKSNECFYWPNREFDHLYSSLRWLKVRVNVFLDTGASVTFTDTNLCNLK